MTNKEKILQNIDKANPKLLEDKPIEVKPILKTGTLFLDMDDEDTEQEEFNLEERMTFDRKLGILRKVKPGGTPLRWTPAKLEHAGEKLLEWLYEDEKNIFLMDFIKDNEFPDRIFIYGDDDPVARRSKKFTELLKKAKRIQENKLAKLGLNNKVNTAMSIFMLKNKHNWADKIEQIVTNDNPPILILGGKIPIPTLTTLNSITVEPNNKQQ